MINKKISILIILIFCFGMIVQSWKMEEIEQRLEKLEIELENSNQKIIELRQEHLYLVYDYELFRDLTSEEFEKTWISFRNVRDNFRVIGYNLKFGSHLDKKDKMSRPRRRSKKN